MAKCTDKPSLCQTEKCACDANNYYIILHTYGIAHNEKMLEYYGVSCFVTQTGNTCTYCWYITLLEPDKQTKIHTTQRINLNNATNPRNLPPLLLLLASSLFSRNYFWLCQVSIAFPKKNLQRLPMIGFFTGQMPFLSPNQQCQSKAVKEKSEKS